MSNTTEGTANAGSGQAGWKGKNVQRSTLNVQRSWYERIWRGTERRM